MLTSLPIFFIFWFEAHENIGGLRRGGGWIYILKGDDFLEFLSYINPKMGITKIWGIGRGGGGGLRFFNDAIF